MLGQVYQGRHTSTYIHLLGSHLLRNVMKLWTSSVAPLVPLHLHLGGFFVAIFVILVYNWWFSWPYSKYTHIIPYNGFRKNTSILWNDPLIAIQNQIFRIFCWIIYVINIKDITVISVIYCITVTGNERLCSPRSIIFHNIAALLSTVWNWSIRPRWWMAW